MKLINNAIILTVIIIANTSCTGLTDDDKTKLYKCEKSAMYLEKNEKLMKKAASWKREQLSLLAQSREDIIENTQKLNNVMMEVMNGEGQLDKSILLDWYNSDYCVSLLKEYQDYEYGHENQKEQEIISANKDIEEALMRQVAHYSTSLVDKNTKEISCDKFKDQFDMTYNNPSSTPFRKELESGLALTIKDSLHNLKKFQIACIDKQITSENIEQFSRSIQQNCSNEKLLSTEIIKTSEVKYCQSKRSLEISEIIKDIDKNDECGDISEVFCLSKIRKIAAENAYSKSEKCDNEDSNDKQCLLDSQQMYSSELVLIELSKLEKAKILYEEHINDPIHNNINDRDENVFTHGGYTEEKIKNLVDQCMIEARNTNPDLNQMSGGMSYAPPEVQKERLEKYERYKKEVCVPSAKSEFIKPAQKILDKILKRLNEINQDEKINGNIESTKTKNISLKTVQESTLKEQQIISEIKPNNTKEKTIMYDKKWESIKNNQNDFINDCKKQEISFLTEIGDVSLSDADKQSTNNCNSQLISLKNCMSKPNADSYRCYTDVFETEGE